MEDKKKEAVLDNTEDEFLTVREFAELAGVSRQAVYQRVKGLDSFTRQVDKGGAKPVTLVSKRALALFEGVKLTDVDLQIDSQEGPKSRQAVYSLVDILMQENERLRAELENQRQSMKDRDKLIVKKDALLADYASRFAELAGQAQQLAAQAQTLHAADKPRLIAAQGEALEVEQGGEAGAEVPPDAAAETVTAPTAAEPGEEQPQAVPPSQAGGEGEDKPRRGFWARFFGLD